MTAGRPVGGLRSASAWTRRAALVLGASLVVAVLGAGTVPPTVMTVTAASGQLGITGQGFGHGRGLGQWGALGYAVDHGWSSRRIVDHYYSGTTSAQVGNPGIGVELLSLAGRDLVATAPGLTVNGIAVPGGSVLVRRNAAGTFTVLQGTGCGGPWSTWNASVGSGLVVAGGGTADPATHVQLCETGQVRGYRGDLQVVSTRSSSAVVNRVLLEDYLRGVVPRESPAGWAALGGGRGAQALQAQAIAARSYAISSPRSSYATTCDTTTCQVYGGEYTRPHGSASRTSLEDPRTDAAIAATAGTVRKLPSGAIARTEFSSSTGGWTAGGTFGAVQDLGDAYAGNPNRTWSVTVSWTDLEARLGVGAIRGLRVDARNGLGAGGGRVVSVVVDTASGAVTLSGATVRSRLGLKSDWFSLSSMGRDEAQAYTRALYQDLLGRTPGPAELSERADQLVRGYPRGSLARDLARSAERAGHLVNETYAAALGRQPSDQERASWASYLLSRRSLPALRASVWGAPEASARRPSDAAWVTGLYQAVLRRTPGSAEVANWSGVLRQRSRSEVATGIVTSEEARRIRLDLYYRTMLARPADRGADGWLPSLTGDGDLTVPVGIAQSPEYVARARGR